MTIAKRLFVVTLAACAPGGIARAGDAVPTVPTAIAAPVGAKLVRRFHAVGSQIYVCDVAPGQTAKFAWTLKAPDAVLSDASGSVAGKHGAGPSWTSKDGSSVTGKKAAEVAAPAPDAIPWLLVRGISNTGNGVFSKVTFIQRLNTKGGKAPASGCDAGTAKAEKRIDYTADYVFFEGGN
jgi:hypothetical protein